MRRWFVIFVLGLAGTDAARAQTEGIFADFVTSRGEFAVWLDYERAPRPVASFVGLATGEMGWVDERTNVWRRPFYDGSIFHRIVKSGNAPAIAIQGGGYMWTSVHTNTGVVSTNFSGPGYTMLDTVANGLLHSNGVISMANSGPNTDGSQFFITVTNVPFYDGRYSVFGHVVRGMEVVRDIAAAELAEGGERPLQDIVVSNVSVRRVGEAAEAFDVTAQGVPSPESAPVGLSWGESNGVPHAVFAVEVSSHSKPLLFSDALDVAAFTNWAHQVMSPGLDYFHTGVTVVWTNSWEVAALGRRHFFHASRVLYPMPITAPLSNRGRTFAFRWNELDLVYSVTFHPVWTQQGTGWSQQGTNEPVARTIFFGDRWRRDAYMARLSFMDDLGKEYRYNLGFNPGQVVNRFTGTFNEMNHPSQRYGISGTFTWE
jgi:peptidyl-prolyl cis-trans isomerase A (cyclophilin A)